MSHTILNVAYPLAPVGRDAAGGAEVILALLDEALVRSGSRSLVIACEGSQVAGTLIGIPSHDGVLDDAVRQEVWGSCRRAIAEVLSSWLVDLIHLHGMDFLQYLPPSGIPALATLHLPPCWYPAQVFGLSRPQTYLNCVSAHQRSTCPSGAAISAVIENGVSIPVPPEERAREDFVLCIGRICPEKGFHLALRAARLASVPIVLAGMLYRYEAHERYFHEEIEPLLDEQHRFIGPVGGRQKEQLLSTARCLLVPSLAPETSSLVAMESLACGTPVVAFASGALPEIIDHGKTGFIVRDEHEMAEAIHEVERLDPEVCRCVAHERFCVNRMRREYLDLYKRLIGESMPKG